jgi:hypothetical protein
VDHVSIALADLQQGVAAFQALGFEVHTRDGRAVIDVGPSAVTLLQASPTAHGRSIVIAGEPGPTQVSDDPAIPLRFVPEPGRDPRTGSHPNTVLHLERVYIAVPDVRAAAPTYARLLDLPVPSVQRGNVIKADMCVFNVGAVGIGVAQPVEPGPAATALDRASFSSCSVPAARPPLPTG